MGPRKSAGSFIRMLLKLSSLPCYRAGTGWNRPGMWELGGSTPPMALLRSWFWVQLWLSVVSRAQFCSWLRSFQPSTSLFRAVAIFPWWSWDAWLRFEEAGSGYCSLLCILFCSDLSFARHWLWCSLFLVQWNHFSFFGYHLVLHYDLMTGVCVFTDQE